MPHLNEKLKNDIVFPENVTDIMFDILKSNGLEQLENEILEKKLDRELFYGAIFGKLLKKIGTGEISFEKFIEELSLQLKIDEQKAIAIAHAAKTKILDLVANEEGAIHAETLKEVLVSPIQNAPTKQTENSSDNYREQLE